MEKIRLHIIRAIILFAACMGISTAAFAAPDFKSATQIGLETGVQGNVTDGYHNQQNVYKFTLAAPGGVSIQIDNPQQKNSNAYWNVVLYDPSFNELVSRYVNGNTSTSYLPTIGLGAGQYYIAVMSANYSSAASQDKYTVTVHLDTSKYYESELNNAFTSADQINVNTPYCGTITRGYHYESDYYRFDLSSAGVVTLKFDHDQMNNSNAYWKVYLYNGSYTELCSRSIYGNATTYSFPSIGLDAGTYYVYIVSSDYSSANSSSVYTLTVQYQSSSFWEKEPNNSYTDATQMSVGSTYNGTVTSGYHYESDYYKFSVSEDASYSITINTVLQSDSGTYYVMSLYDSSYKSLASVDVKGNQTSHNIQAALSSGTYYVYIRSANYSSTLSESNYSIRVYKPVSTSSTTGTSPSTNTSSSTGTTSTTTTSGSSSRPAAAGTKFTAGTSYTGITYQVTSSVDKTVAVTGCGSLLKKVTIPSAVTWNGVTYSITSVAPAAFKKNKKITSVSVGSNVTVIGAGAFRGAVKLKTAKLGSSVAVIGATAFYNCRSLRKITIPKSVTSIGKSAFRKCRSLRKITIKTTALTSSAVGAKAFAATPSNVKVNVPNSLRRSYRKILTKKGLSKNASIK